MKFSVRSSFWGKFLAAFLFTVCAFGAAEAAASSPAGAADPSESVRTGIGPDAPEGLDVCSRLCRGRDRNRALRARDYATEHMSNTFGQLSSHDRGPEYRAEYTFSFTSGAKRKVARLRRMFKPIDATYIAIKAPYSYEFLYKVYEKVLADRKLLSRGDLWAPGPEPGNFSFGMDIELGTIPLYKPKCQPAFRAWMHRRWGPRVTCEIGFSGW